MSSELLRRAATLMRERAQAAAPGPWQVFASHRGGPMITDTEIGDVAKVAATGAREENATHIASWHPDVALTAAQVLTWAATLIEAHEVNADCPCIPEPTYHALERFAYAYLGEVAP